MPEFAEDGIKSLMGRSLGELYYVWDAVVAVAAVGWYEAYRMHVTKEPAIDKDYIKSETIIMRNIFFNPSST